MTQQESQTWQRQWELIFEYMKNGAWSEEEAKHKGNNLQDDEFIMGHAFIWDDKARQAPFNCRRLAARISDIKRFIEKETLPYLVETFTFPGTNGVKAYFLVDLTLKETGSITPIKTKRKPKPKPKKKLG